MHWLREFSFIRWFSRPFVPPSRGGSISLGLFHCRQATGEKGCHARTDSKSSSPKAGVNAEALQLFESGKARGGKTWRCMVNETNNLLKACTDNNGGIYKATGPLGGVEMVAFPMSKQGFVSVTAWRLGNHEILTATFAVFFFFFLRALNNTKPWSIETHHENSRWWFQRCFIFTPTWKNDPIWLIFFEMGLKPPTSENSMGFSSSLKSWDYRNLQHPRGFFQLVTFTSDDVSTQGPANPINTQ